MVEMILSIFISFAYCVIFRLNEEREKWIIYLTGSSLLERQIDCVHIFRWIEKNTNKHWTRRIQGMKWKGRNKNKNKNKIINEWVWK